MGELSPAKVRRASIARCGSSRRVASPADATNTNFKSSCRSAPAASTTRVGVRTVIASCSAPPSSGAPTAGPSACPARRRGRLAALPCRSRRTRTRGREDRLHPRRAQRPRGDPSRRRVPRDASRAAVAAHDARQRHVGVRATGAEEFQRARMQRRWSGCGVSSSAVTAPRRPLSSARTLDPRRRRRRPRRLLVADTQSAQRPRTLVSVTLAGTRVALHHAPNNRGRSPSARRGVRERSDADNRDTTQQAPPTLEMGERSVPLGDPWVPAVIAKGSSRAGGAYGSPHGRRRQSRARRGRRPVADGAACPAAFSIREHYGSVTR